MINFTQEQLKVIFNSVRYYQINKAPLNGKLYQDCDEILNMIFPTAKDTKSNNE
jgi:hypothetical protein